MTKGTWLAVFAAAVVGALGGVVVRERSDAAEAIARAEEAIARAEEAKKALARAALELEAARKACVDAGSRCVHRGDAGVDEDPYIDVGDFAHDSMWDSLYEEP